MQLRSFARVVIALTCIAAIIISLSFAILPRSSASPTDARLAEHVAQTPGGPPAWVIWETSEPIQRVAQNNSTIWAGSRDAGLFQWSSEAGPIAAFSTEQGLPGHEVLAVTQDAAGNTWLALGQDGVARIGADHQVVNMTPPSLRGVKAWDLAAHNNEIWLATLGGGVARYANGSWTSYTTASSGLPADDVYAVAVAADGTPWIGTIGYGVAALQNNSWTAYDLPVTIADPRAATKRIANDAVMDIAFDSAGDVWFATDGSGVVVLDRSSDQYTVYDTSTSGLTSNYVQRILIDEQGQHWFGTLDGGVNKLLADRTSWESYTTRTSRLTEDDVLDLTIDEAQGLWLASYDAGLSYFGPLPTTAPQFNLEPGNAPAFKPGTVKGFYLWLDPETYVWTLAWSSDQRNHSFSGMLEANGALALSGTPDLEPGETALVFGESLQIDATERTGADQIQFTLDRSVTELTLKLTIDGAYYPFNFHVGEQAKRPGTLPFRLATPQPVAPIVATDADQTVSEGDPVYLSAQVTDIDSLSGHRHTWDLGDGTMISDSLSLSHAFGDNGVFTTTATVTDIHGLSSSDSTIVTVENVAPNVNFAIDPFEPIAGRALTFNGDIFDPGTADTHTLAWDFGDGSPAQTSTALSITHTYANPGNYTAKLTVTDDDGGVGELSQGILVEPANFALAFDGVDDVARGATPDGNTAALKTLDLWLRPETAQQNTVIVSTVEPQTLTPMGWSLELVAGRVVWKAQNLLVKQTATHPTVLAAGTWQHIAITYDGMTARVFVNGVPGDAAPMINLMNGPDLWLNPGRTFTGQLDELRLSSVVRYTQAFTPPTQGYTVDNTTLGLYHFDESVGQTASNSSGQSKSLLLGTVTGSDAADPAWVYSRAPSAAQ